MKPSTRQQAEPLPPRITPLTAWTRGAIGRYAQALTQTPRLARPQRWTGGMSLVRLIPYAWPYTWRFIVMLLFAFVGIGMAVITPLVTKSVIDGPILHGQAKGVIALGAVALSLGVVEAFVQFLRRWTQPRATMGTETGIRLELYAKLQRLPLEFHHQWQSGQLLSRIMNDLGVIRRFLGFGFIMLIVTSVQMVAISVLLIRMYLPLGIIIAITIVPVMIFCLIMHRQYRVISRRLQDQTGDAASVVEESVLGFKVIKAFGRGSYIYSKYDDQASKLFQTSMQRVRIISIFWTFLEVIPSLTLVAVLGIGAMAAAQAQLSLGTLVAFINLLLLLVWPVSKLGWLLSMAQEAMTAADRVVEVFDATETIRDGNQVLQKPQGRLSFDQVGYTFPNAETPVLSRINLEIAPGETVALVGGTGCGKTTLIQLIPRLMDVTEGSIRIDGIDIRELSLDQLRTIVACAFDDPTLFSMSARENLIFGKPNASDQEIAQAIDVAQAQFVYDLPWGLDTRLGEKGMSLSGGQRQRLALARAVIAQPVIMVLDDTLSALDVHTEALVEKALRQVLATVSGIVVATRASTVLLADRVALLESGTITHIGTHSELLASVPHYRELLCAEFNVETELDVLMDHDRQGAGIAD